MGQRGARHHDSQKPRCPKCQSRNVTPAGPVKTVRWIDRALARCGGCGNEWSSENRKLVELAGQMEWA